ncbi:MAG: sugar kinase [Chloroflexi bacterium]|nr:sugar kinase [Chloroflexota bacterium]
MPRDVSAIGPLNVDLLITGQGPANWEAITTWDGPSNVEMTAAGSVGYTAQDLAKLGLSVQVCSCLPDDPLGTFIQAALQRASVDTELVRVVQDTVGAIGVYMLLFGSRKRPLTYRLPTHDFWPLYFTPDEVERLLDARLLHTGGYLHFEAAWHGDLVGLYRQARERGLVTSLDPQFPLFDLPRPWLPALEDVLPNVDVLFCDETEARSLTAKSSLDDAARCLLRAGAGVVVIKQGGEGATIYREGTRLHQPAVALGGVVDTIGAGDAFDAGFLYGTLHDWSLERRALFAGIAAGFTVTGVGGSQTMPSLEQVMAELQARESR